MFVMSGKDEKPENAKDSMPRKLIELLNDLLAGVEEHDVLWFNGKDELYLISPCNVCRHWYNHQIQEWERND